MSYGIVCSPNFDVASRWKFKNKQLFQLDGKKGK